MTHLRTALQAALRYRYRLRIDPAFEPLRTDPRSHRLVAGPS